MFISKLLKMVSLSILLASSAEVSIARGADAVALPVPEFCRSTPYEGEHFIIKMHRYECNGVEAFNKGHYRAASVWFTVIGDWHAFESPSTGRFTLLAYALTKLDGESTRAQAAIDTAYVIKMVMAGYIPCDRNRDFEIGPSKYTTGLSHEVLNEAGSRVCTPFFNRGTWERASNGRFDNPYILGGEYERIRKLIGIGRPLPVNN
jgi:hypothetical protein